ncbi:MAG: U32 family peptidase [Bacteroidales bacterium]|nr:U32 family peptidase [Bacteroidales bacterium]
MKTSKKDIEITSPVGSFEALAAAIQAGAKSVYFGIDKLNMRARSSINFSMDDLKQIVKTCKTNKLKTYLTLNTVMYNQDLKLMQNIIDRAVTEGVDAIIASDISVIEYASSKGISVHISTQCNISNIEAVRFYSRFADVMVLARELSLKQIAEITEAIEKENIKGPAGKKIKIEIFAHGALCMAISGKCYLSLHNLNASANRGECLQICRRPYQVKDKDGGIELEIDNEYIMSPKDLCTIDLIDKIIKAGVKVLKIEGRGRSPEYVKIVTQCYNEAVSSYFKGTYNLENTINWKNKLKSVYNRDFWEGYYLGRKMGEWTEKYGSHATETKEYIGKVTNFFTKLKVAEIKIETGALYTGDKIYIIGPTTGVNEAEIKEIRVNLKKVKQAVKGDYCSIPLKTLIRRSDKVYKIVKSEF